LDTTFGWWDKGWDAHKSHLQWVKPKTHASLQKPNLVTRVASQFDGIGWDKAKKIGDCMDWQEFAATDESELQEIEGIGPILAQRIINQMEE